MVKRSALVTFGPEATLDIVAREMNKKRIGCVVVVDTISHKPIGVITKSDLIKCAYAAGSSPNPGAVLARDVMSSSLVTVDGEASRDEAAEKLFSNKVHHLVVVDKESGAFLGITTSFDICKEVYLDQKAFPYSRESLEVLDKKPKEPEENLYYFNAHSHNIKFI